MRISDWSSDVCSSDLAPEKRVGRMDENRVRLDREGQADAGKPVDGLCKTRSTLVPMFGIAKPRAAFEQPYPGCGEKAHFRGKLDRKSTRLNSSHYSESRMTSSACKKKKKLHNSNIKHTTKTH